MQCPSCGAQNPDVARFCANCRTAISAGPGPSAPPPPPPPASAPFNMAGVLVPAILAFFCCQPLGIAAIIFAVMANSSHNSGDLAGSSKNSGIAKTCSWIAIGLGLLFWVGYIVLMVLGVVAGGMS